MEVKHSNAERNGVFYIEENGVRQAEMTYVWANTDKFIIDHTEVFPGNEGKGLGKILVQAAVDYARANNFKIMPLCPFAKKVFDKTPEYADVRFQ